ncbi:MAG: dephospho-CoA kinase [Chthoniobacteraceae bacterium]
MPALGITGGIATGKSTFSRLLVQELSAEFFDSDKCAHELLASDRFVRECVRERFGSEVFHDDGTPNRIALRERIFCDDNARKKLEEILHPRIRERWMALTEDAKSGKNWLCIDIPLLYETRAEQHFDRVIVVACSAATQNQRLRVARGLSDDIAARIIAAQLDLREKISRATHLIWNDSTPVSLERQATLLAHWLRHRYG